MIVCFLLPYFATQMVRRTRNLPEHTPIILRSGEKVAACCATAAARGVTFNMTLGQVKWLCPDAQVIPIDYQAIRQQMGEIVEVLSQFTHRIELERLPAKLKPRTNPFPDPRQSVVYYVDLERLNARDTMFLIQEMGRVVREASDFSSASGLAAGKFPAYAAATQAAAGQVKTIPSGDEATFLAPLPITLLPMSEETRRRLLLLAIQTLGVFAALPVDAAAAQCGKNGASLYDMACGRDPRRVVPTALQVVEQVTRELEVPVCDSTMLEALLRSMATELSIRLQVAGSMGKTLALQVSLDGHEAVQQKTMLRQPVSSARYLSEALLRLLARTEITSGVCGLVITLADLMPFAGQQLELFPEQPKPRERLQQRLSSLLTRSAYPVCYWITTQDPTASRLEQRYGRERVRPL